MKTSCKTNLRALMISAVIPGRGTIHNSSVRNIGCVHVSHQKSTKPSWSFLSRPISAAVDKLSSRH